MPSFRYRIRRATLVLLATLLALFGLLLYAAVSSLLHRHVDAELQTLALAEVERVEAATGVFHEPEGEGEARDEHEEREVQEAARSSRVLDEKGQTVWEGVAAAPRPSLPTDLLSRVRNGAIVYDTIVTGTGAPVRRISVPIAREGRVRYILQSETSLDLVRTTLGLLIWSLAGLAVVIMALAWAGSGWLAREALTPVAQLSQTAERISGPSLDTRLMLDAPYAEFRRLADAFNAMLERLQKVYDAQRRFVADAAHEIQTPLTVIKGNLEVALQRARTVEEYEDAIGTSLGEADRLIALTRSLLTLAQLSGDRPPLKRVPLALEPMLRDLAGELGVLANDRKIHLTLELRPVPQILADPGWLKQVWINLLGNAIRYTAPGGVITVRLAAEVGLESRVVVQVEDTGAGIPPEHLPHVFERFYRADRARTRESGGTGLGLAIVKEIVAAHGGEVQVRSEAGKGSVFTVTLPALRDAAGLST